MTANQKAFQEMYYGNSLAHSLTKFKAKEREENKSKIVESYVLGLLTEECGEVSQVVGKCIRFGIDTPSGPQLNAPSGRDTLHIECGDILAAIEYAIERGVLDREKLNNRKEEKLSKLLNPKALDNLGRRLAP